MTNKQNNTLNMHELVQLVLTTNAAVWSSNPAMSTVVATINSHLSAVGADKIVQNANSKGITQTKQMAQLNMAVAAVAIANAGKAYAAATSNQTLYNAMNHTKSEILGATDNMADTICQGIYNDIAPYIASTVAYGANSTSLANLLTLINTYSALIGTPALQLTLISSATLTLDQNLNALNGLLKTQLDPLMTQYQTSNPVFYNQYQAAREIKDLGHRHTVILTGFIYNSSNMALANATVSLSGTATHTKITTATGQYKFKRLHTGNYTITVTANGYVTQTQNITVNENGTVHTDFTLVTDGGVGSGIGVGTV